MAALEQEHNRKGPFHGVTGSYISFDDEFVKYPYVSVMLEATGSQTGNVNAFVRTVSVKGFDIEFSHEFSGYVHYIASRQL